jgi:hypothetical protein
MSLDLTILANGESAGRVLFAVFVVILVIGGGIFEKLKQQAAEAERRRRSPLPPSPAGRTPPMARPPLGRDDSPGFPPPVPPPPGSERWPPVAVPYPGPTRRPVEQPRPRSQGEQTGQSSRSRRRKAAREEMSRPIEARPAVPAVLPEAATQHAASETERQVESDFRGQGGVLKPVESLIQIRARQQKSPASGVDPAVFRTPTIADLRRAIVLNEILGPPVGLREGE